jgi:DNA-binding CsgD family transcriptional regulator
MLQVRVGADTFTFEGDREVVVGRASTSDVCIEDARVSRVHLRCSPTTVGWVITDVQSANGSFVNGKRVTEFTCLQPTTVRLADAKRGVEVHLSPVGQTATVVVEHTTDGPTLSGRERELVALVAGGASDQQIADALHISIRTVRSHLDRIQMKTGRRRRADLTRLAFEQGIDPISP